jgi:hypothetical protein
LFIFFGRNLEFMLLIVLVLLLTQKYLTGSLDLVPPPFFGLGTACPQKVVAETTDR